VRVGVDFLEKDEEPDPEPWTTICCLYHNFVRWDIIVCSLIRV
jgi:hypothetical protein